MAHRVEVGNSNGRSAAPASAGGNERRVGTHRVVHPSGAAAMAQLPCRNRTRSKRRNGRTLIVDHLAQFFASLKEGDFLGRDMDALTCLRVPAIP
jgi:hypothetical protein